MFTIRLCLRVRSSTLRLAMRAVLTDYVVKKLAALYDLHHYVQVVSRLRAPRP